MPLDLSLKSGTRRSAALEPLVQLFPGASAVRIPVAVSNRGGTGPHSLAKVTIEFGTSRVVIFLTELPLEIDDRIHLENGDGSLVADAFVIAVQYQDQVRGIAAQFTGEVRNWIIQV